MKCSDAPESSNQVALDEDLIFDRARTSDNGERGPRRTSGHWRAGDRRVVGGGVGRRRGTDWAALGAGVQAEENGWLAGWAAMHCRGAELFAVVTREQ